jgi:hypothetical protein
VHSRSVCCEVCGREPTAAPKSCAETALPELDATKATPNQRHIGLILGFSGESGSVTAQVRRRSRNALGLSAERANPDKEVCPMGGAAGGRWRN